MYPPRTDRRLRFTALLLSLIVLSAGCSSSRETLTDAKPGQEAKPAVAAEQAKPGVQSTDQAVPKNIILLIADGCGPASYTMARDYLRMQNLGSELRIDEINLGSVSTYAADLPITDSAASATAYACGVKTNNGRIAMDPAGAPLETIIERAQARGKATGVVATSRITHATPASFISHVPLRAMEEEIAAQAAESGVDVLFGGGLRFFVRQEDGGSRTDGRDLIAEMTENGMTVALDRPSFDDLATTPAVALLSSDHMPYEIDREESMPSIADLTSRAIGLLVDDPDGFFLMVEGSRIDHAAHANDAAGHLFEILAFDLAVGVALDFAEQSGETLVVSVADHETGGLTIGREVDGRGSYTWKPDVLDAVSKSHDRIIEAIEQEQLSAAEAVERFTPVSDLSLAEIDTLSNYSGYLLGRQISRIVAKRAGIGWTTGGHTAVDVGLYAFGVGSERFVGHHDNTYVGQVLFELIPQRAARIAD